MSGQMYERPDSGADDESVVDEWGTADVRKHYHTLHQSQKHKHRKSHSNHHKSSRAQAKDDIPERVSIDEDHKTYYTWPAGWKGQQVPGQGFERPDTGVDDENVLHQKKKHQHHKHH